MHPVNKGLVPIHYKYFVRNLTLHHFLLSPVAWNIHVSINLASYTLSTLAGHANITQYSRYSRTHENIPEHSRIFFHVSGIVAGKQATISIYQMVH